MKKIYILSLIVAFVSFEVMAQRDRPSAGRTSGRTGSSSSSSGSSSSTTSGGGSYSGGGSSGGGNYSGGGSDYSGGSSYGGSYGGGSYTYTPTPRYGVDYVNRARTRIRGRNTAPILEHRIRNGWGNPITSGNVSATPAYYSGQYRVRRHSVYTNFGACHSRYYSSPRGYYVVAQRNFIYNDWLMEPAPFYYGNGYHCMNGYPYYVHNGYRYRYSNEDLCNYDLVDLDDNYVVKTYRDIKCNEAFDTCAAKRDQLNEFKDYQKYVCVEKVDDDLSNDDVDNIPGMINNLTPQQVREVTDFVKSKSPMKLFKIGSKDGYKNCKIFKLKRTNSEYSCNYEVRVGDKTYPMTNGSVCSNSKKTKLKYYGCNSGSQMKNAACLLSLAILEGYCQ